MPRNRRHVLIAYGLQPVHEHGAQPTNVYGDATQSQARLKLRMATPVSNQYVWWMSVEGKGPVIEMNM